MVSQLLDVAGRFPHGLSDLRRGFPVCLAVEHERKRLPSDRQQTEQRFDYAAVKKIYDNNCDAEIGSRLSRAIGRLRGAGFLPHGSRGYAGLFQGAPTSTRTTAHSWSFPRRRACAAPTTDLNRKIMAPVPRRFASVVENESLPVPEAMHHYYMAQSYVASVASSPGFEGVGASDTSGSDESQSSTSCKRRFFWIRTRVPRRPKPPLPPWNARGIPLRIFWP